MYKGFAIKETPNLSGMTYFIYQRPKIVFKALGSVRFVGKSRLYDAFVSYLSDFEGYIVDSSAPLMMHFD